MDRHAHQPSPRRGASFRPDQQEAFDGLLLALLARKRLLVLAGAGMERSSVFARLTEQVTADGSLVLPVVAQHGMQVEDLVATAAVAAGIQPQGEEPDFDALIEEVESQLDMAGSGLLAVDDAHLLTPATLQDLAELSRSETGAGRFLQILLSGAPDLERALARPGLQQAIRDTGVVYRVVGDGPPSVAAQPAENAPIAFTRVHRTAPPAESPHHAAGPDAADWTVPPMVTAPPPLRHRRSPAAIWATAALVLLVGGAGALVALQQLRPDLDIEGTAARWGEQAGTLWAEATDTASAWSHDTLGWPRRTDEEALALARERYPELMEPRGQLAALPQPPQPSVTRTLAMEAPAALPPAEKPAPVAPPLPRSEPAPSAGESGPLPPTIVLPPAARIPDVPLPAVPEPPAAPPPVALAPVPAQPAAPSTAVPPATTPPAAQPADAGATQRARALVDQARRQIAGKRLTTPPGDNANETVQRLRELAPDTAEIPALVDTMVTTYRRWAAQAEKDGSPSEAKRYLERALVVSPSDQTLRAQLNKGDERPSAQTARLPSSEVTDGFADQETTLAILHQPASLRAVLTAGHDPNKRLENGKTPLMLASEAGLRDAARQLVERGANPNLRTRDGATAIMYAAWNGHDDLVSLLADAGANVNAGNDDGKTALMAASARGHAGVVRALLARGAVVDRAANHGWTALMYAAHAGNEPVARLLVDAGANPQRTDQMGNSAVTLSRQQGHNQTMGALTGR